MPSAQTHMGLNLTILRSQPKPKQELDAKLTMPPKFIKNSQRKVYKHSVVYVFFCQSLFILTSKVDSIILVSSHLQLLFDLLLILLSLGPHLFAIQN